GSFEIRQPGSLTLRVVDVDGQPSRDAFTAPVTVLTDERPFVRLLEPPARSFATPDAALPVVIAAEDDYGISRVELYRSLNDSRPLPLEVPVKQPAPTRWQERVVLPFSTYGLQPGDEIKLFARVEDNDPAGPKGAESTVIVVRIISQADLDRLVRARQGLEMLLSKYQQAQRRLEALAGQVEEMQKKGDQAKPEDLKQLAEKMRQEAEAMRQAARKPMEYDLDRNLSQHLERLAKQLQEAADEAESLSRKPGLTPQQMAAGLAGLQKRLQQQRQQLEQELTGPLE